MPINLKKVSFLKHEIFHIKSWIPLKKIFALKAIKMKKLFNRYFLSFFEEKVKQIWT
ncbi:MAG: hypothetical protein CM1200mP28_08630 [Deltaproteobacteria bacterium]|nr:MAG: hypothetical protein CM1200mP28_08630 [Deltaproteobacteria bacterium]